MEADSGQALAPFTPVLSWSSKHKSTLFQSELRVRRGPEDDSCFSLFSGTCLQKCLNIPFLLLSPS